MKDLWYITYPQNKLTSTFNRQVINIKFNPRDILPASSANHCQNQQHMKMQNHRTHSVASSGIHIIIYKFSQYRCIPALYKDLWLRKFAITFWRRTTSFPALGMEGNLENRMSRKNATPIRSYCSQMKREREMIYIALDRGRNYATKTIWTIIIGLIWARWQSREN
jgi:hypothetical protein